MAANLDKYKTQAIAKAARLANAKAGPRANSRANGRAGRFVRDYYANVSARDIAGRAAADLAGWAGALLRTAAKRTAGKANIRVYNPRSDRDGWQSDHTIIEIVTDDMPFLVDSVTTELTQLGMTVQLSIHPIIWVRRGKNGALLDVVDSRSDAANGESFIGVEVSQQTGEARFAEITKRLHAVLSDVRAAVEDWQKMRMRVLDIVEELKNLSASTSGDIAEAREFLQWVHDDNFTFLGYRDCNFKGTGAQARVLVDTKSDLGVLRDSRVQVLSELRHMAPLPADVKSFIARPDPILVSKADKKSTIHRPVYMDLIGVKHFDARGKVIGERLIVGLFTSVAYNKSPRDIPLLRRKLDNTLLKAGFAPSSHDGKALLNILENFPRDELFQIDDDDLLDISRGILQLQERQRVALFTRIDRFQRFVSCQVFVPRERYSTTLRAALQEILERAIGGKTTAFATQIGDSPLARLHAIVTTRPGHLARLDLDALEAELTEAARSWTDKLQAALVQAYGEERGNQVCAVYGNAFPAGYAERFSAERAVSDITKVEDAAQTGQLAMDLYSPEGAGGANFRFKIFHPREPLPLSDVLPMLEHMGLKVIDEIPHAVRPQGGDCDLVMIHDFGLVTRDASKVNLEAVRDQFQAAFQRVWSGEMESDGFNALVLGAGLDWREVVVLRTIAKYLRQVRIPFSQAYMEQTLANNPKIARRIVQLFEVRFDPALQASQNRRAVRLALDIQDALEKVASADEDRILRRFVNVVDAALRTNFYQPDAEGTPKPYLSIKLDSAQIDEMPLPRPMREIFVYSPRFEAIHLRGGMVARGGLRWSDRPEDFRTEILGLMKAQMIKNAVIVPVGSKGGFILKRPPADGGREAFIAEGIACYKTFISGLLDVTDNLDGDKIVAPRHVIRHDGDDTYLVVAADKGTATFSDIANGISAEYGYWLGDAFASGGSVGYDHKKMAITARGAWESVKRHFREIGKDIQKKDFDVIGVGDMSGDVFGNAMLLSKHIRLIGAFNHMHIFVDPDPDPATSWAERSRLFRLPRSAWSDYDSALISKGGGVYARSAKSITLSPQARKAFGLTKNQVTPNELIRAMLACETELLWFGGIGTYVKAHTETDLDADDRANDALRVDAGDLKCQVIGEGANLGVTQRGRIEYALGGGRLNTDSVDNSAGVDCSDHEVNIKILLDAAVAGKKLGMKERNNLLVRMTKEVADLVLRDNYLQTQSISLIESEAAELLDEQVRVMKMLERAGRLDRAVEFLPDDEELAEREADKKGLTRPEISVVMPYAKLWLYDELLDSDLPDDPEMTEDLVRYFPTPLHRKFTKEIGRHRLRREIIATVATNSMINRVGGTFVTGMMEKTGTKPADIARAYIITRDAFDLRGIWHQIEALDNKVRTRAQVTLLHDVNRLVERATLWLLRYGRQPLDIGKTIKEFRPGIEILGQAVESVLPADVISRINHRAGSYELDGVPRPLARRVAYLIILVSALDIVRTSRACALDVEATARLYFDIGERFGLGWLRYGAEKLPADNHWQKLAADALIEELYAHQRGLTLRVVNSANGRDRAQALDGWIKNNAAQMERTQQMLGELGAAEVVDISMLAVASRHLGTLSTGQDG